VWENRKVREKVGKGMTSHGNDGKRLGKRLKDGKTGIGQRKVGKM
jgi:hypothetical protein